MARFGALSKSPVVAALDLGSSKICCLIAKIDGPRLRLLGLGHQQSTGMKNGAIVDTAAVEAAILNVVHEAEQAAQQTVSKVVVNISGAGVHSAQLRMEQNIGGQEVTRRHIEQLLATAEKTALLNDNQPVRRLIHSFPLEYSVDFEKGLRDPRGLHAETLSASIHSISASEANLRTLYACIQRCHLEVVGLSVSPFAAALAAMSDDERESGATLIDIGGGTTSVAVFKNNMPARLETIPLGGNHITADIAHALSVSFGEAERIKTLYASAMPEPQSHEQRVVIETLGDLGAVRRKDISSSMLVGFVQPRLEEIFEMVRDKIESSSMNQYANRRLVMVGGTSRIPRIGELAGILLEKQVRLGAPTNLAGVSEMHRGPEFCVVAGLLNFAKDKGHLQVATLNENVTAKNTTQRKRGDFLKLGHWLKTYF